MKTLHLVIPTVLILALGTSCTAHGQYATNTAPILTVWTDKSNYVTNDTVTVAGYVAMPEAKFVHKLQVTVSNPNGIWYKQDQFPVDQDGRFSYQFKIEGDLAVSGHYLVRVWSMDESGMDVGTSFNVDSAINSSVVNMLVKQGSTELAYSGDNITETIEYNITVEPKFAGSLYVDIFKNSHLLRTDTLGTPDIISFFGTGGQYYHYKLTISGKKDQDIYKINFRYDGKSIEKVIPLTSTRNGIINGTATNVSPQHAKINVTFNEKTNSPIVITGTVYKLFSTIIVLKIQNPQGNFIAVSQLQPAPDGTFSLTIVPSNPLWSMKGNYTVTVASDSQELVKTTFYFDGNASSQTTSNGINTLGIALSPLRQFKSGISAKDVKCNQGLQLIFKAKDGSPACARPQTAQKLVERKWGWAMQPIDPIKPLPNRIIGLENNTGMVTFGNQTYYFVTPNYTDTDYSNPVQVSFHDVVFTLFPPGFRGGLPSGGCGSDDTVGKIVTGGGSYYWTDAKFSDDIHELLHMFADSHPCPIYPKQTDFSNHTNPQAGLTFYDGKMKLLVSADRQISSSANYTKELKITDDTTYLLQTVDEWKSKTPEQLKAYYEKYKDAFYDELGSFLIKDEMKKELARQKIQNVHDDFKVFPGMSLDSLPPHISYDAVVNATDGNSYLLLGGVFANKIESSPKIIKLVFDKNALHSLSTGNGPSYPDPSANAPVDNSTSQEKLQIAGTYIEDSDIPWSSVGTGNYGVIQIGLYTSVYHMIPDAQQYYTARAMQLIPFYVPVKILPPPSTEKQS